MQHFFSPNLAELLVFASRVYYSHFPVLEVVINFSSFVCYPNAAFFKRNKKIESNMALQILIYRCHVVGRSHHKETNLKGEDSEQPEVEDNYYMVYSISVGSEQALAQIWLSDAKNKEDC